MEEQFITYELAIQLKELGYDGMCFGYYYIDSKHFGKTLFALELIEATEGNVEMDLFQNNPNWSYFCAALLWQQALDWFRNKFKLHTMIEFTYGGGSGIDPVYYGYIIDEDTAKIIKETRYVYDKFKDCQTNCLEKLIEITKLRLNNNL